MKNIFIRSSENPILKPNPAEAWEAFKVYNPGAVYENGVYHLFYRAMNRSEDWHSTIGHAISADGETFKRQSAPALVPETPEEKRGLEDPRITKIGDTYFMAYAAYDGEDVRLNIATSNNLETWRKRGAAFADFAFLKNGGHIFRCEQGAIRSYDQKAAGKERSKAGAIFPEKIGGKYWMVFGEYDMWLATSEDGLRWNVLPGVFLSPRDGHFDNAYIEAGPPPVRTEKGWLVIYHGIDEWKTYRLGFLLLDIDDPSKVLYRSDAPIMEPETAYEETGYVDVLPGGLHVMQVDN